MKDETKKWRVKGWCNSEELTELQIELLARVEAAGTFTTYLLGREESKNCNGALTNLQLKLPGMRGEKRRLKRGTTMIRLGDESKTRLKEVKSWTITTITREELAPPAAASSMFIPYLIPIKEKAEIIQSR